MSEVLPEGASCASHPDTPASWTCARCGSFMCPACERRIRPEARPMCPACWALRAQRVEANQGRGGGTALQTTGLVLGLLALVPMCVAFQLASLIVNIVALVKAKEPPASLVRWRPITGLVLTAVGAVLTLIIWMRAR
ncbi:MAG: hypothetical protein ACJ8AT_15930 [Hyalangium sp.]|uniref:hypothetical protein n=1 Tax=Hyalangium sp. TaxID=2028555 RepID=UPI003899D95F